jgi:adenylosuccinate synthase
LEDGIVDQGLGSLMVVGGQWGDEGKGKVVDLLSHAFPAVVRYNGGHNAGHTVRFADRRFALHLVPSGIIHDTSNCYLGAGMVIDPSALVSELDRLIAEGVDPSGRLFLSTRATLILPSHRALDHAREGARGAGKIGTTGRGIGPAYADSAQRRALRAFLLAEPSRLADRAAACIDVHNRELVDLLGADPVDATAAVNELLIAAERVAPLLREVGPELERHAGRGEPILFEGAQGVLLDLLYGTYPFVTSSCCLPSYAAASCGVGAAMLGPVVGIMKAYTTRVGGGPFPSELEDADGERLRERGAEFGTTTGRPRRCGWFDAVAARYAVRSAGIDALAIMKLDVLDGFETLRVVTGYRLPDGSTLDTVPADLELLEQVIPVTEELPGWSSPTAGLVDERQLPPETTAYLGFLEERLGVPVVLASTGPRRDETMIRGSGPLASSLRRIIQAS